MDKKYIDELCKLIEIPSAFSEVSVAGGPFGRDVKMALEEVLSFAEDLGFSTVNHEGYTGEINIGHGDYIIGVLCHIDVVPEGRGWDEDAFKARIKGDKIYGRGSSDDKGPIMAVMSAVKRIIDEGGITDNVTIRMIIGTNEEELWGGINYYLRKAPKLPDISIVPDGAFPLIFCEKGLIDLNIKDTHKARKNCSEKLISINGGDGRNIVASWAEAEVQITDTLSLKTEIEEYATIKGYRAEVRVNGQNVFIRVAGKSAHAMSPEKGINAISQLIDILANTCKDFSHEEFVNAYSRFIGTGYSGDEAGFACADLDSGPLTFNIGEIESDGDNVTIIANIRYPASLEYDVINRKIVKGLGAGGFTTEQVDFLPPVHFDRDSYLVNILMNAYQSVTGDFDSQPIAMGGATYARAIPNAVSFGALFPYEEDLAHEPNEYQSIESLEKAEKIYYEALKELIKQAFKKM